MHSRSLRTALKLQPSCKKVLEYDCRPGKAADANRRSVDRAHQEPQKQLCPGIMAVRRRLDAGWRPKPVWCTDHAWLFLFLAAAGVSVLWDECS